MSLQSAALLFALCVAAAFPNSATAQNGGEPDRQRDTEAHPRSETAQEARHAADLDLEQLANIDVKVTSASKKSESLLGAAAAIFVLTGEELRRGGFTSIPEALRTVPGLYVAQEDSHSWIVSARGFSYAFNNKMLVLLDGRLLYQPLFGGVYWDTIDPPMQDIERIEIIRGPGGTLWGANAVNGVINIITRSSDRTEGTSLVTSYGVNEGYKASLRYGGEWGKGLTYRAWGQAFYGEPTVDPSGAPQLNAWYLSQGGARVDWSPTSRDTFSFEGEGYRGEIGTSEVNFPGPSAPGSVQLDQDIPNYGGSFLGRWKRRFSDRSSSDVLAYCAWFDRVDILGGDRRSTCDVEVQHNFSFTPRHSVIWGGSILTTIDTASTTFEISYSPAKQRDTTYSLFGQYEVSLVPDKVRFIGGAKIEHNPFTGFEIQPQARAVWTPNKSSALWGAVSRAVREPDRLNSDADLKVAEVPGGPLPVFLAAVGSQSLQSEVLRAYELGYRYQPRDSLSFDLSAFYNQYDKLIIVGSAGAPVVFPDYIEIPLPFVNGGTGQTHGLELAAQVRPIPRWSLSAGVTEIRGVTTVQGVQGVATPRHILNVQSRFDLTRHFNFDSTYFYTDALKDLSLPTLNRVDVGFSTRQFAGFSFGVWGRNLQAARHLESNSAEPYFPAGQIRRSVVFKLMWESQPETAGKPSR